MDQRYYISKKTDNGKINTLLYQKQYKKYILTFKQILNVQKYYNMFIENLMMILIKDRFLYMELQITIK